MPLASPFELETVYDISILLSLTYHNQRPQFSPIGTFKMWPHKALLWISHTLSSPICNPPPPPPLPPHINDNPSLPENLRQLSSCNVQHQHCMYKFSSPLPISPPPSPPQMIPSILLLQRCNFKPNLRNTSFLTDDRSCIYLLYPPPLYTSPHCGTRGKQGLCGEISSP